MHIIWLDMLVNVCCVVFRLIIAQVFLTRLIINLKYCCVFPSKSQKYLVSIAQEHCQLIVLLTMPTVVVLLMWMGVGGCGCPSLSRVRWRILASWALRKRAPNLALAADAGTSLRMVQVMWIASSSLIGLPSTGKLPRKK
jgi:hypothetical protein